MTDQIDLHETGSGLIPFGPGPHRDRVLQQRSRLGMGPAPRIQFGPVRLEPAVNRRRRYPQQQRRRPLINIQLPEPPQPRHQIRQSRRQQPPARRALHRPAEPQRLNDGLVIDQRSRRPRTDNPDRQDQTQRLAGMITVPARHRADLIQDLALPGLGSTPVFRGQNLRDSPAFAHRQLHSSSPTPASEPAAADTPLRAHYQMILRYPLRAHLL